MRIGIVTRYASIVGGAQSYLSRLVLRLAARGHDIAFVSELVSWPDSEPIVASRLPIPIWSAEQLGFDAVLRRLADWKPEVVLMQGPGEPTWAERIADAFATVFRAENYFGTCISGTKTTCWPTTTPCSRVFGPACLLHYFPRRCGGLNPFTMWRLYRRERHNNRLLRKFRAILTLSEHMRQEFVRHGVPADRVIRLPFPVSESACLSDAVPPTRDREAFHLLFLGRMDRLKGGDLLLRALPLIGQHLGRPVHLDMAGEGPERVSWEGLAEEVTSVCHGVTVRFHGWVRSDKRNELLRQADLLVVPSIWPEPFGHVGLEAAQHGVPAVAFAVGGIPEWLQDGVTGRLAPSDPPTVEGLAEAICACLADDSKLAALRRNAYEFASRFSMDSHVEVMEEVFRRVVG
ncbi:MAG: glycosyltransferase family 4 protein [Gemmatales bacterium]|nr:glycosyltransferase family 4 protein [Gemmatales bacterium]MDW8385604.1 glycosyltransferase family 4 protein [Gemmatales bacterium]